MKFLCIFPACYTFAYGGGAKASHALFKGLVAEGHQVTVVDTGSHPNAAFHESIAALPADLTGEPAMPVKTSELDGVKILSTADGRDFTLLALQQSRSFAPDWTVMVHDRSLKLTQFLFKAVKGRVVWMVHSTHTLPFGPDSFAEALPYEELEVVRRLAGVIVVSRFQQDYLRWWAGVEAEILRYPAFGDGPFPNFGERAGGKVMLINHGACKGQPVFNDIARRMPETQFAIVPTWGGSEKDLDEVRQLKNVEVIEPRANIDEILERARILLAPSLWHEGLPLTTIEAMVRGIPVLTSNAGGAPEGVLGMDWAVLPVHDIRNYERQPAASKLVMPTPVVPAQDVAPWVRALNALLGNKELYARRSREVRQRATDFVKGASATQFADYFRKLDAVPSSKRAMSV